MHCCFDSTLQTTSYMVVRTTILTIYCLYAVPSKTQSWQYKLPRMTRAPQRACAATCRSLHPNSHTSQPCTTACLAPPTQPPS